MLKGRGPATTQYGLCFADDKTPLSRPALYFSFFFSTLSRATHLHNEASVHPHDY